MRSILLTPILCDLSSSVNFGGGLNVGGSASLFLSRLAVAARFFWYAISFLMAFLWAIALHFLADYSYAVKFLLGDSEYKLLKLVSFDCLVGFSQYSLYLGVL